MLSTPFYGKLAAVIHERFKVGGGALARTAFPLFLSAVRLALRTERHGSNAMHSVCSWDGPVCVSTCVRGGSMPPVFSYSCLLFLLSMFIQPAESRLRAGRGLCTPGGLFCSILRFACFLANVFATRVRLLFFSFSPLGHSVRLFPSLQLSCRHVPCLTQLRTTLIVLQIDCAALGPLRQDQERLEKTAPVPRVDNRQAAPTRERRCDEEPPPRAPASSKATQEEGDRHKVKGERTSLYVHQPSPAHALPPCGAYECIPLFFRQTRALASPPLLWSQCRSCTMKKKANKNKQVLQMMKRVTSPSVSAWGTQSPAHRRLPP